VPVIADVAIEEGNIWLTLFASVFVVIVDAMPISKGRELTFVPNIEPIVLCENETFILLNEPTAAPELRCVCP
jgi:hypothetical protein